MNTETILIIIGSLVLVSLIVLIIVLLKRKPSKSVSSSQPAQQSFTLDDDEESSSRYNRTFVLLQKEEKEKKTPVRSKEGTVSMDPNESNNNYNYRNEAPVNSRGSRAGNEERTGVLFAPANAPHDYTQPASSNNKPAYSDNTELLAVDNSGAAYLEFYQDGVVNRISLDRPSILIGRLRGEVDYVVNNSKVSKIHAEIICRGGCYFIKDYNSGNGTYINGSGKKIPSNVEQRVYNNDRISLANSEFVLKC
mgnify:CR=1 FL=1